MFKIIFETVKSGAGLHRSILQNVDIQGGLASTADVEYS